VRFITSVYGTGAARWGEVDAGLAEAEAISERLGDRRLLGDTWSVQGLVGLLRGRFEPARAVFQRAYEHGVRNDNVQQQVRTCIGRAEYELLAGGDLDAAVDLLHTALGLLADHPEPTLEFVAQGRLAVARLRQGDRQAALAAATAATRLDAELGRPTAFYRFAGYAGVAQVYLALRRPEEARRACAALRRFARIFPIGTPSAWLLTGRLLALSGHRGRARAAWRASLAAAERLAMPFDAALAHQELGRVARGEQRRAWHLQQAQALLEKLGVAHDPAARQPGRDSRG
jgi:tetratricopeptide (TPR) repeat protein